MLKKSLFIAAALFTAQTFAAAPKAATGNPGYYRFHIGDIEVNTLNDGTFMLPPGKLLSKIKAEEVKADLAKNFLGESVETSDDAFLVNTGTKIILVDTGAGPNMGPTAGHLLESMKNAGYKPEQVDAIVITHMHGDHIGGLTASGKAVFPNATLYIDKADVDYWTNKENAKGKPEMMQKMFEAAEPAIAPYKKSGHFQEITGDMEITPGVHTKAAHGHTPGHETYWVENGDQKLLLLGDTVHVASVQFEKPSACMSFDSDIATAEKFRQQVFADAAKHGYMIGAAHLPFPGIGHLRAEKKGFAYVPANYTR
jgi:glyoxylase-like metal-dependent hydrolase (beta-lactamase superfamily II)